MAEVSLNEYQIKDADVLFLLKQWGFKENKNRKLVMQPGVKVFSDTLGRGGGGDPADCHCRQGHRSEGSSRDGRLHIRQHGAEPLDAIEDVGRHTEGISMHFDQREQKLCW
jgi:hypothetical protein